MRRRLALALVLALALLAPLLPAGAQPAEGLPDLDAIDPVRSSYEDAIVESYQVPVRLRETGDSRSPVDQIWIDVVRPATDERVPAIMMSSPYYTTLGRGWQGEFKTPATEEFGPLVGAPLLADGEPQVPFPEWYDEYFVPRGYAYVAMDLRGTRNSSGCQVYGDRDEVLDAVDVIDFIADQGWSNGKVAMTGGSYDGTIAIGAAAEQPISGRHPEALAAITPIRAIDRWYDYHFFNGVQSSSHAATPALFTAVLAGADVQNNPTQDLLYPLHVVERKACIATLGAAVDVGYARPYQDATEPFWAERDFQKDLAAASEANTAIFLLHGLFDYNVKTNNTGHLWENLPEDLPRKLWLFNGDHVDPHVPTVEDAEAGGHVMPSPFQAAFVEATHRWFLQFLKGVDAGALRTPEVEVQREDGSFVDGGSFPASTSDLALSLTPEETAVTGEAPAGEIAYRDGPTGSAPTSRTFTSEPLAEDTRVSGQFGFDLDIATEGPDTSIAVTILSVPPDADPGDDSTDVMAPGRTEPLLIGYGWLRASYRDSVPLRGLSTPTGLGPVDNPMPSGVRTPVEFGSLYTDVVIPAGHRLAFRFSNSAGGTVADNTGGDVTLFTGGEDGSRVLVPVAPDDGEVPPPTPGPGSEPPPVPTAPPTPAPSPTAAPSPAPSPDAEAEVERIGAEDRVATAIAASGGSFADGSASAVVLARADDFPDALAGTPLAVALDAPLLLTPPDALDPRVAAELDRVLADGGRVALLGGEQALTPDVERAVAELGARTERYGGADRFGTAVQIAQRGLAEPDELLLASGADFPDALAAGAAAGVRGGAVLLTGGDDLPPATAAYLDDHPSAALVAVGGPSAAAVPGADPIVGATRVETAALVAQRLVGEPTVVGLATAGAFADALAGGADVARRGGPVLLSPPDRLPPVVADYLTARAERLEEVVLYGGSEALGEAVAAQVRAAVE